MIGHMPMCSKCQLLRVGLRNCDNVDLVISLLDTIRENSLANPEADVTPVNDDNGRERTNGSFKVIEL